MSRLGDRGALLVLGVAVLIGLDLAGGIVAIATDVNPASQAWGSHARLAAPWPMVLLQLATASLAVGRRPRVGVGAAALLAAACFVSSVSGVFDGSLGARELAGWQMSLQVVLVSWTALVGVAALVQAAARVRVLRAAPAGL